MWCGRHNSTASTATEQELPNASHILGNNANTGREIEQSQEVESKYVPEEGKAHFSLPWQRESLSGEEEEKSLTHL